MEGKVRMGMARLGFARECVNRQGKTWLFMARQGVARQGKE
jgi:hypothetical protein